MGMYTWLTDQEFERYSSVEDKEMNEIFQDVRKVNPYIYISERKVYLRRFLRKTKIETAYTIYHRVRPGDNEVHVLNLSRKYYAVCSYLFGLFNGYNQCLLDTDKNTLQNN